MPLRQVNLGGSGLIVPVCCMGTMTMGEQTNEEESFALLDYCMSRDVNFIDTAELYPVPPQEETAAATELIIGRWMASRGNRDKVILATKVSGPSPGLDRAWIPNVRSDPPAVSDAQPRLTPDQIRAACDASLRRMQTTFIDLYQIHWPERYAPLWGSRQYKAGSEKLDVDVVANIEDTVRTLGELLASGKIRYWGLSNETTYGVCLYAAACAKLGVAKPVSIQNDFSLVARSFDEELAEACAPAAYNVHLLAYGPLAGGTLSGKYHDKHMPLESARHTLFGKFQPRYHSERTMAATAKYMELAKAKGITATQLALAWCAGRWYMGSVIIGATTLEQLKENIDACEMELDDDTCASIDEIHCSARNPNNTD
ncbi:hypothetical protein FOA52_014359 [Chlamydomonas sp. UWO 241]|nr:hypothetical protein FOA52_014359 [Chlamydomonas sp. UWO 241]